MLFMSKFNHGSKMGKHLRSSKIVLIGISIILTSIGSGIIVSNYSIMEEDVSVEQAVVVDGVQGSAQLDTGLPNQNIVGTTHENKSWSMKVNLNGTVSVPVSLTGEDSGKVQTHFTHNISQNHGMALIVDEKLLSGSNDKTLDLSDGSATVNLVGPTDTVSDGLRFKTYFPINYDITGSEPGENMEFTISLDASGASLN